MRGLQRKHTDLQCLGTRVKCQLRFAVSLFSWPVLGAVCALSPQILAMSAQGDVIPFYRLGTYDQVTYLTPFKLRDKAGIQTRSVRCFLKHKPVLTLSLINLMSFLKPQFPPHLQKGSSFLSCFLHRIVMRLAGYTHTRTHTYTLIEIFKPLGPC